MQLSVNATRRDGLGDRLHDGNGAGCAIPGVIDLQARFLKPDPAAIVKAD
jgi:hypothetical protein